jgi:hypothetical protein
MRLYALLPLGLAACSAVPGDDSTAPANTIEGNSGAALAPAATPLPAAASAEPAEQGMPPETSVPPLDESAEGAAAVARTYYALLGERKYRQAWTLWAGGGRQSGMSAKDFAASFAKYADYRAEIGPPGRIEGAAGSRYVTVPVRAYGHLAEGGRPFNLRGNVTLRRAVADGATLLEQRWQIHSTDLKPRPGEPLPQASASPAAPPARIALRCIDGSRFVARFDPGARQVTIDAGGKTRVLHQERVPSGFRYGAGGYTLEATGETYTFTTPGRPPMPCAVNRRR